MVIGIHKRQLILLLFVVFAPLILNIVAIWEDVRETTLLKMLSGAYPHPLLGFLGGPYNPLPEIFSKLIFFTLALGVLAWLMIFISNMDFFQKQSTIAKILETLLMACFVATVYNISTGLLMPLIWLPMFHDYLLGLPGSSFTVNWSLWFIFPSTAIILFVITLTMSH